MNADQALKDEKPSLIDFHTYRTPAFSKQQNIFFSCLSIFYFFVINQLSFNKTKQSKSSFLTKEKNNVLHIEICSKKIYTLLAQGQICAADIRCLDVNSKQCLNKLCLKTCLYRTPKPNSASQQQKHANLQKNKES